MSTPVHPFASLAGKVCVITGGAGYIGQAFAQALAAHGLHVAVLDFHAERAAAFAAQLTQTHGVPTLGLGVNVLERATLIAASEQIQAQLGPVAFLINCAGGNSPQATTQSEQIDDPHHLAGSFFDFTEAGIDFVTDLNFKGSLLPAQVFGAGMVARRAGVIINISSVSSFLPLTKVAGYSAAKAAINNFTRWLAAHFGRTGVRVNAIAPGFFLTDQNRFLLTDEKTGELTPRGHQIIAQTPMRRFGEVEDLTGTLLFLLSDLSAFMTGAIVPVDGGFTAFGRV